MHTVDSISNLNICSFPTFYTKCQSLVRDKRIVIIALLAITIIALAIATFRYLKPNSKFAPWKKVPPIPLQSNSSFSPFQSPTLPLSNSAPSTPLNSHHFSLSPLNPESFAQSAIGSQPVVTVISHPIPVEEIHSVISALYQEVMFSRLSANSATKAVSPLPFAFTIVEEEEEPGMPAELINNKGLTATKPLRIQYKFNSELRDFPLTYFLSSINWRELNSVAKLKKDVYHQYNQFLARNDRVLQLDVTNESCKPFLNRYSGSTYKFLNKLLTMGRIVNEVGLHTNVELSEDTRSKRAKRVNDFAKRILFSCMMTANELMTLPLSLKEGQVLYRKARFSDAYRNQHFIPEKIYVEPGFFSTTTTPNNLNMKDVNTLFIIQAVTGKSIKLYSYNPTENEFLFPPGTKFKVLSNQFEFPPYHELSQPRNEKGGVIDPSRVIKLVECL